MPKADSTTTSDATTTLEPSSKKRGKDKKEAKAEKASKKHKAASTDAPREKAAEAAEKGADTSKTKGENKSKDKGKDKSKDKGKDKDKDKGNDTKKKAASGEPSFKYVAKKKLSTGKGATPAEIGKSLVQLFNSGKADDVSRLWHHKKIESIEGDGMVFVGRKGIDEKNAWWYGAYEMHAAHAEGPFVGATGFAVHFAISVTPRAGGERMDFREVGVYTVEKGKIVREEFMGLQPG